MRNFKPLLPLLLFIQIFSSDICAHETNKTQINEDTKIENKDSDKDTENKGEDETAKGKESRIEPEKIGNFALGPSQIPVPLSTFGENIVEKGDLIFYTAADFISLSGRNNYNSEITPGLLYGITDDFSVFLNVPFAPKNKERNHRSSGLEDISLQFEYAYFTKDTKSSSLQATVVGNIAFATGSHTKTPPTGLGSINFFTGLTLTYTGVIWIYVAELGVLLPTKHRGFRAGNQYFYNAAIGKNICTTPNWIFALFAEFSGLYACKDSLNNHKDPDSGGNTITCFPSLWISSENLSLQLGIGLPIYQHLFGKQLKERITYSLRFGWKFDFINK
ncbi:MAG: hypothetical protein C5B43_04725 [Verrucomicrobia bacterium]|nr:MAG: hypothetical protein C5B43_04725 [Verrucomicrobiota bacterium]